jgi:hypothetical protein
MTADGTWTTDTAAILLGALAYAAGAGIGALLAMLVLA